MEFRKAVINKILESIRKRYMATISDIMQDTGLARVTIHRYLIYLLCKGKVKEIKYPSVSVFKIPEEGEELSDPFKEVD